jgi:hypothetical protein
MPKSEDRINRELNLVLRKMQRELYSRQELQQYKKLKNQLEPSVRDATRIKIQKSCLPGHKCSNGISVSDKELIFSYDLFEPTPLINFQNEGDQTIISEQ